MKKYLYIAGGAFVALLLIVGGAVFFLGRKSTEPTSDITPTTWSQEGDYEIKTIDGKTIVANKKAGYSFTVPAGWKIERAQGTIIGQTVVHLSSPDSMFDKNLRITRGCLMSMETISQEIDVARVRNTISNLTSGIATSEEGEVIAVDHSKALKEKLTSGDTGKAIHLALPLSKSLLFESWIEFKTTQEKECAQGFDSFVDSIKLRQ